MSGLALSKWATKDASPASPTPLGTITKSTSTAQPAESQISAMANLPARPTMAVYAPPYRLNKPRYANRNRTSKVSAIIVAPELSPEDAVEEISDRYLRRMRLKLMEHKEAQKTETQAALKKAGSQPFTEGSNDTAVALTKEKYVARINLMIMEEQEAERIEVLAVFEKVGQANHTITTASTTIAATTTATVPTAEPLSKATSTAVPSENPADSTVASTSVTDAKTITGTTPPTGLASSRYANIGV